MWHNLLSVFNVYENLLLRFGSLYCVGSLIGRSNGNYVGVEVGRHGLLDSLGNNTAVFNNVARHEEYTENSEDCDDSGKPPSGFFYKVIGAANAHNLISTAELRRKTSAFRLLNKHYTNH